MYPSCPIEPSPQVNKALTLEPDPDEDAAVDRAANPDCGLCSDNDCNDDSNGGGAMAAVRCTSA